MRRQETQINTRAYRPTRLAEAKISDMLKLEHWYIFYKYIE